jgi:hypothetical protein
MGQKHLGRVLVLLGTALVAMSVVADALGIGAGDYVFGWEQKAGVAIGCAVVAFACLNMRGWRLSIEKRQAPAENRRRASASL